METQWSPELLEQMRHDWDARAREDARYYVASGKREWTAQEFFRSGETNVREQILTDMTNICQGRDPARMRVLEIGCGAGRITRALAKIFGRVDGVDVSGEMVARARAALHGGLALRQLAEMFREGAARVREALRGELPVRRLAEALVEVGRLVPDALLEFPNARVYQNNGSDLAMFPDAAFDFAFSFIVFQHIPSKAVIENYVREVRRVLQPGALFKFQVQGVPLEDEPLDTWLGAGFTEDQMREMAGRCGFEMRHTYSAGPQYLWLWFFKLSRP